MAESNKSFIPFEPDVVIVGAGIAGLSAAAELVASGRRVLVLEKSRGVGGRMATRRAGEAVYDHGAQFFTVRGRAFGGMVAEAHEAAAVATWCEGFAQAASIGAEVTPAVDGHARWRGMSGMTDLPKRLAAVLPSDRCVLRTAVKVAGIGAVEDRVRIAVDPGVEAGEPTVIYAAAAIVTSPVPQSLDLFATTHHRALRPLLRAHARDQSSEPRAAAGRHPVRRRADLVARRQPAEGDFGGAGTHRACVGGF
jgi:hypothetical protein